MFAFGTLIFTIYFRHAPFTNSASSDDPLYKLVIEGKYDEFFAIHKKSLSEREILELSADLL